MCRARAISEAGCWTGIQVIHLLLSRNHRLPLSLYLHLTTVWQPLKNMKNFSVLHRNVICWDTTICKVFKWQRSRKHMDRSDSWKMRLVVSLWQYASCYLRCIASRRTRCNLSSKVSLSELILYVFLQDFIKTAKSLRKKLLETIMPFKTFSRVIPVFQLLEEER